MNFEVNISSFFQGLVNKAIHFMITKKGHVLVYFNDIGTYNVYPISTRFVTCMVNVKNCIV